MRPATGPTSWCSTRVPTRPTGRRSRRCAAPGTSWCASTAGGDRAATEQLERLGVRPLRLESGATTEDAALILADACDASLIVGVGMHATLDEFLDRQRPGLASTYLTRLKVGPAAGRRHRRAAALLRPGPPAPPLPGDAGRPRGPRRRDLASPRSGGEWADSLRSALPTSSTPSSSPRPRPSTCKDRSRDLLPTPRRLAGGRLPRPRRRRRPRRRPAQRAGPRRPSPTSASTARRAAGLAARRRASATQFATAAAPTLYAGRLQDHAVSILTHARRRRRRRQRRSRPRSRRPAGSVAGTYEAQPGARRRLREVAGRHPGQPADDPARTTAWSPADASTYDRIGQLLGLAVSGRHASRSTRPPRSGRAWPAPSWCLAGRRPSRTALVLVVLGSHDADDAILSGLLSGLADRDDGRGRRRGHRLRRSTGTSRRCAPSRSPTRSRPSTAPTPPWARSPPCSPWPGR